MVITTDIEKSPRIGETKLDSINKLLLTLLPLQDLMERLVGIEKKFQFILYEPTLLFKYKKDWIAFLIAFKFYDSYKTAEVTKIEDIKSTVEQIRLHDKDLAEDIERILPVTKIKTDIFTDLLKSLRNGKEYFVSYISTHLSELITKAKSIEDIRLSNQLVTSFSSISGHEVDYLIRYRLDTDNWTNYIVSYGSYGIGFFIKRLNLYLKGGYEDNTQFMGLYKDFGDAKLTKNILSSNYIRNLWRYNEQVRYLNFLIGLCRKSETSAKWEDFYGSNGFWGEEGDENGKNFSKHIETFEIKYGNKYFADILKAQKKYIGENPQGWGGVWQGNRLVKPGFLHRLLAMLQHPSYQRQKIILPASLELHKILKNREEQLRVEKDKLIKELITLLQEAEGISIAKAKVISKFLRLLKRKKRLLIKELESNMGELFNKAFNPLSDYDEFLNELNGVIYKMEFQYINEKTSKLVEVAQSNLMYVQKQLRTEQFLRDIRNLVLIDGADSSAKIAITNKSKIERFEHISEDDLKIIHELIPRIKDTIRKLRVVYNYIRFKIEQEYVITIEDLERLDVNRRKNRKFEFGYVKRVFSSLI